MAEWLGATGPRMGRERFGYALAVLATLIAAAVRWALAVAVGSLPPYITFYPAMMLCALIGGTGPGLLATLLGALTASLLFIAPQGELGITGVTDLAGLVLFCAMGVAISLIGGRLRAARLRAEAVAAELHSVAQFPAENPHPVLRLGNQGQVLYANPAAEALLIGEGWQPGQAALAPLREAADAALRSGNISEFDLSCCGGRVFSFACMPMPAKRYANLYGRDVTETRRAEAELRQSRQHFSAFMDHLPGAAWMKDVGGRYLYANPEAERIFSKSLAQLVGRTDAEIFPLETARQFSENDRRALTEGTLQSTEVLRQADGIEHHSIISKFAVPGPDTVPACIGGVAFDITERVRAEEAVRSAQAQLQHITDTMAAGVTRCSRDLRYLWVSPAYARWLGRSPEQIAGHPIVEIIGARGYEDIRPHVEQVLSGEPVEYETEVDFLGAGQRWINARYTPTRDAAGAVDGWVAVVTDITRRKQAEIEAEALRHRLAADLAGMGRLHEISTRLGGQADLHALLVEILDAAIGITKADMGNAQLLDEGSGTLKITVHRGFEQPFLDFFNSVGEGEAACGNSLKRGGRVIVEDVAHSRLYSESARAAMLAAGAQAVVTTPLVCRSGRLVGMLSTHYRTAIRPEARDLQLLDLLARQAADFIERTQAEEALRESEARLRRAMAVETVGVIFFKTDGRITDANDAFLRMSGYSREDLQNGRVRWDAMTPPEWMAESRRAVEQFVATGQTAPYEKAYIRKDGSRWWGLFAATRLSEGEGIEFIIDISDRKVAEEALSAAKLSAERAGAAAERSAQQAEQANAAKNQFLAVLSHELRTPLTPVVAAVSMLQKQWHGDQASCETLEMIGRNVEMEARLIDDLLDVTRIVRGKIALDRRPVPLCEVIRRAVEVCKPDIEARQLHLGVDIGPDVPYLIHADAARLQQVFWNLLKNAIKFTPHGGCVGIRCRLDDHSVVAEVTDSGEGIDPAVLPTVFNPFEQGGTRVTRQFGGLGLGLTITKGLVEMHGGSISAHSAGKGKGTTFRVRLPIHTSHESSPPSREPKDTAATAASRPAAPGPRPLRILLVEDHGDTARIMRRLLMADGHEVETAGDVATATELAQSKPFDLIISDLGLPDGSGIDLMTGLRQRGNSVPGIALSGYGQDEDIRRSREAGFAEHLTKPTNPDRLAEAIAAVSGGIVGAT